MKLNNRFIFGILSLVLAAVIAFVALPTIARQTNGKTEIVRITQPVLKGEKITRGRLHPYQQGQYRPCFLGCGAQRHPLWQGRHFADCENAGLRPVG